MSTSPRPMSGREARLGEQLMVLSGFAGGWSEVTKLLDEARRTLGVDEASLLLLDASGTMLVPVASSGLESAGHSGFRVQVGDGFFGQIAATARPLIMAEVNPDTPLNPILHRRGIRSLIGVPVAGRSGQLGVVHVGSVTPGAFTAEDTAQLEQLAARISVEVLRRRTSEEHIAALALQRSLLPSRTPRIDGLDISARYVPADGDLGGDWYDVFRLPDNRIGIVMGDVAGHGLAAAVVMGRLRSALRAYALEHPEPADVLRLLDTKISYFEAGAVATVSYAVAEPPYARFTISSAGHLPPFLVIPHESPRLADVPPDPPLGVRGPAAGSWTRHNSTIELPSGASLCFFTDGLIERRPAGGADGDQIDEGLERLRTALRHGSADAACAAVLTELAGDEMTEDDIAVVVLRRLPAPADQGSR